MLVTRWTLRACLAALSLLLLVQCSTDEKQPLAPKASSLGNTNCPAGANVVRDFTLLYPATGVSESGCCSRAVWQVENACGPVRVVIDAWYDGVETKLPVMDLTQTSCHLDKPNGPCDLAAGRAAKNEVIYKFTAYDDLGVIDTQSVILSPIVAPARPNRVPQEHAN